MLRRAQVTSAQATRCRNSHKYSPTLHITLHTCDPLGSQICCVGIRRPQTVYGTDRDGGLQCLQFRILIFVKLDYRISIGGMGITPKQTVNHRP